MNRCGSFERQDQRRRVTDEDLFDSLLHPTAFFAFTVNVYGTPMGSALGVVAVLAEALTVNEPTAMPLA